MAGFKYRKSQAGGGTTGNVFTFAVDAAHATLLAPGDAVVITGDGSATGVSEVDTGNATTANTGVIESVDPTIAGESLTDIGLLALTAGTVKVRVDQYALYEIDADATYDAASVGLNMGRKRTVHLAAIDSTGLQSHHCSSYYVKRRSREPNLWQTTTYKRFPKVGIICDTSNHMILEAHPSRGPCPDAAEFKTPLKRATQNVRIAVIVADAGYDSESNHCFARDELAVRSIIPANAGRPTQKPASGKYRRQMQTRFDKQKYGQRWQCETVISMIKRRQAVATKGRSYWSQCRDLFLIALTHNIMIIFVLK